MSNHRGFFTLRAVNMKKIVHVNHLGPATTATHGVLTAAGTQERCGRMKWLVNEWGTGPQTTATAAAAAVSRTKRAYGHMHPIIACNTIALATKDAGISLRGAILLDRVDLCALSAFFCHVCRNPYRNFFRYRIFKWVTDLARCRRLAGCPIFPPRVAQCCRH